jgi:hypothetical protein
MGCHNGPEANVRVLGQSLVTFVFQISGAGIGTLAGLAILEMFHNVGGYTFNPYGICAVLAVYALPLHYLLYEHPSSSFLACSPSTLQGRRSSISMST